MADVLQDVKLMLGVRKGGWDDLGKAALGGLLVDAVF
jgi:hypothetical protein